MRILADKNNPFLTEAFGEIGNVELTETSDFTPAKVRDADALVIRSDTKITKELLGGSRVRFVGAASTGSDHVDTEYLESRGIGFANAPGCNANSVAEYTLVALLRHCDRRKIGLSGKTLGIVGVGNIGSRVAEKAEAFGMRVLLNDPPLARKTGLRFFVSLDELMGADFISLHVPLTKTGGDATYHLFDAKRIGAMKRGSVLINTARGAVIDSESLKQAVKSGHLSAALLDVWENEPDVDPELLSTVELGTSHIAGYSFDGKVNAVQMIHRAMAEFFSLAGKWAGPTKLPPAKVTKMTVQRNSEQDIERDLWDVVRRCYDIEIDDAAMRALLGLNPGERQTAFRQLRAQYPVRREFRATSVVVKPEDSELRRALAALGFTV
jgi:erythronate-4-phosphate dehydrogenase